MTLTVYTTIAHFQSMFWLIMVYHQTKLLCKKIFSSKDIHSTNNHIWLYKPSHSLWPWDSNPVLMQGILPNDDAPPYQIWLQKPWKVDWFRKYLLVKAGHTDMVTNSSIPLSQLCYGSYNKWYSRGNQLTQWYSQRTGKCLTAQKNIIWTNKLKFFNL